MKCLIFDCKSFSYTLDHPTPVAEAGTQNAVHSFSKCLVLLACIEQNDNEEKMRVASIDIAKIARELERHEIVLNPFAHLANSLAKPRIAISLLKELATQLSAGNNFNVHCCPFGWYKAFDFSVLGHGSSQLFRSF